MQRSLILFGVFSLVLFVVVGSLSFVLRTGLPGDEEGQPRLAPPEVEQVGLHLESKLQAEMTSSEKEFELATIKYDTTENHLAATILYNPEPESSDWLIVQNQIWTEELVNKAAELTEEQFNVKVTAADIESEGEKVWGATHYRYRIDRYHYEGTPAMRDLR